MEAAGEGECHRGHHRHQRRVLGVRELAPEAGIEVVRVEDRLRPGQPEPERVVVRGRVPLAPDRGDERDECPDREQHGTDPRRPPGEARIRPWPRLRRQREPPRPGGDGAGGDERHGDEHDARDGEREAEHEGEGEDEAEERPAREVARARAGARPLRAIRSRRGARGGRLRRPGGGGRSRRGRGRSSRVRHLDHGHVRPELEALADLHAERAGRDVVGDHPLRAAQRHLGAREEPELERRRRSSRGLTFSPGPGSCEEGGAPRRRPPRRSPATESGRGRRRAPWSRRSRRAGRGRCRRGCGSDG